jgi:hypothetical protein
MSNVIKLVLAVALILFLTALGPWLIIWSWNTLFGAVHTIVFDFWTWLAVILLSIFLRAQFVYKK